MIFLLFLAALMFFSGISHLIIYYVFNIGELVREFHVGSASIKAILSIPIAFLLLCVLIYYLRWSCFKKRNKILEFIIFWFYSLLSLGIFVLLFFLRSEEHTSELQSRFDIVCRLLLAKKNT